jgi:uncharacterized protein YbjT (DUF2867 family)
MTEYPLAWTIKGSKTTVQGDAKVIPVDYSNDESIKHALAGVDVVISTISAAALDVQGKIAAVSKEVGVKLFIPSDFGAEAEAEFGGMFAQKADILGQLKAMGVPYATFYTGPFADFIWASYVSLTSGHSIQLTKGQKVLRARRHERESVRWWRR